MYTIFFVSSRELVYIRRLPGTHRHTGINPYYIPVGAGDKNNETHTGLRGEKSLPEEGEAETGEGGKAGTDRRAK